MSKRGLFSFVYVCFAVVFAWGDLIIVTCGDQLTGKVLSIRNDVLRFETEYAGILSIKCGDIVHIESDSVMFARTDPKVEGDRREVTLSADDDGNVLFIPREEQDRRLALRDVSTLWLPEVEDPDFPKLKLWSTSVSLGFDGHTGSQTTKSMSGSLTGIRTTQNNTLMLKGNGGYGETNGEKITQNITLSVDYEARPYEHHSWYLRDSIHHNDIQNIMYRNTLATGYGWYIWNIRDGNQIKTLLRLRTGIAHTYSSYYHDLTEQDIAVDFGVLFHYMFQTGVIWNTELSLQPEIADFSQYYAVHESKFEYFIDFLEVSQEIGVRHEILNADGVDSPTEMYWFLRLKRSW